VDSGSLAGKESARVLSSIFSRVARTLLCPWGDPLGPSLLCSWASYQIFVRKSGLMLDIVKHDEFSR